ncbi:hypothetical protein GOODEAATRI_026093 [Goodea atripinnis]|uniref:Uncharacterized protein n=1 Tax=Goodea atripinnis TaxID=208336 RepID=A0ABV0N4E5_9TELE
MVSLPYAEARLWRFWSDSMTNQTGAWSGPQTALLLRRESYHAPSSALLTPGPPWKWKGYSTTKARVCLEPRERCILSFRAILRHLCVSHLHICWGRPLRQLQVLAAGSG